MDLASIERKLEAGELLKIKYRYPRETGETCRCSRYGVRFDRLLDVSVENRRLFARFRGEVPIWIEEDEVIEIVPDDGIYTEFGEE